MLAANESSTLQYMCPQQLALLASDKLFITLQAFLAHDRFKLKVFQKASYAYTASAPCSVHVQAGVVSMMMNFLELNHKSRQ